LILSSFSLTFIQVAGNNITIHLDGVSHGSFGNSPLFLDINLDLSLQLISVDIPIAVFLLISSVCSVMIAYLIFI
jgi:hypothetical protein